LIWRTAAAREDGLVRRVALGASLDAGGESHHIEKELHTRDRHAACRVPGEPSATAGAVNALGQVVGFSATPGDAEEHALLWQNGTNDRPDSNSQLGDGTNELRRVVPTLVAVP